MGDRISTLWVTERVGKRVVRINPATGARDVLVTIPEVFQSVTQDGLLGMTFHPDFLRGEQPTTSSTWRSRTTRTPAPRRRRG